MCAHWDDKNSYVTRIKKFWSQMEVKKKKKKKKKKQGNGTPSQGTSENERRQPINTLVKTQKTT